MKKKILCLAFVLVLIFQTGCVSGDIRVEKHFNNYEKLLAYFNDVTINHYGEWYKSKNYSEEIHGNLCEILCILKTESIHNKIFEYYKSKNLATEMQYTCGYTIDAITTPKQYRELQSLDEPHFPDIAHVSAGAPAILKNGDKDLITLSTIFYFHCETVMKYNSGQLDKTSADYKDKHYSICECTRDIYNLGDTVFCGEDYEDPNLDIDVQIDNSGNMRLYWNGENHSNCWKSFIESCYSLYIDCFITKDDGYIDEESIIPKELFCEWVKELIYNDVDIFLIDDELTISSSTAKILKIK